MHLLSLLTFNWFFRNCFRQQQFIQTVQRHNLLKLYDVLVIIQYLLQEVVHPDAPPFATRGRQFPSGLLRYPATLAECLVDDVWPKFIQQVGVVLYDSPSDRFWCEQEICFIFVLQWSNDSFSNVSAVHIVTGHWFFSVLSLLLYWSGRLKMSFTSLPSEVYAHPLIDSMTPTSDLPITSQARYELHHGGLDQAMTTYNVYCWQHGYSMIKRFCKIYMIQNTTVTVLKCKICIDKKYLCSINVLILIHHIKGEIQRNNSISTFKGKWSTLQNNVYLILTR